MFFFGFVFLLFLVLFFGFGLSSLIAVCCFGFANDIKQPKRSGQFSVTRKRQKGYVHGGAYHIYIYRYLYIHMYIYIHLFIYLCI